MHSKSIIKESGFSAKWGNICIIYNYPDKNNYPFPLIGVLTLGFRMRITQGHISHFSTRIPEVYLRVDVGGSVSPLWANEQFVGFVGFLCETCYFNFFCFIDFEFYINSE